LGLLTEDDVTRAVDAVALAWIGALPPLSEGERIAGRLRDYLDRHQDDVIDYDHHPEGAPVPADLRVIRHQQWVLFTEEAFAAACGDTPSKVAAEVLRDHGMLHRETGKLRSRHVLGKLGLRRAAYFAVFAKHLLPDSELVGAAGPAPEEVPGEGDPEPEGL
jgi:hypothetical protein